MDRVCPVRGCGAPLRKGHAMCRECWHRTSTFHRRNVSQRWRQFQSAPLDERLQAINRYRGALALAVSDSETRR